MNTSDDLPYQPTDTLYLWWLGRPASPVYVGELHMARQTKGVSFIYSQAWLSAGFALSEDLPLVQREFFPTEKETAVGAIDDARPDRWGERVIRLIDKPPRLSVLDFLFYAGDERFGALGVSLSAQAYRPRSVGPMPVLADVQAIEHLVQQILAGEPVDESLRRLLVPGASLGGACPKALVHLEGRPWVLKFKEPGALFNTPLIEHATMTLAAQAGIRVARTQAIALQQGHAVAVQRFDREAGLRRHAISAHVALRAANEPTGYPELAQWLRRRGVATGGLYREQMHELFRRMVFNILIDNTDDHEKNHVLLMMDSGEYALSPAFDVLPSGHALGYQQMRVGSQAGDSTLSNALSECRQFGLTPSEATEHIRSVCKVIASWKSHFANLGVTARDIESLTAQIDRPFLRDQRI